MTSETLAAHLEAFDNLLTTYEELKLKLANSEHIKIDKEIALQELQEKYDKAILDLEMAKSIIGELTIKLKQL